MSIKANVTKFIKSTDERAEAVVALKAAYKGKSEARSMLADMVAKVLSKTAKPSAKYEYVFSRKQKAGAKAYLALFANADEAKAALTA